MASLSFRIPRLCAGVCALVGLTSIAAAQTHVHLKVDDHGLVPSAVQRAAIGEAAEIWRGHGIAIDASAVDSCNTSPGTSIVVNVQRGTPESGSGMGAVRFSRDGIPDAAVTVYYDTIERLATSVTIAGVHASFWPAALREQMVARVLGRALAHELGHVFLRWPHHPGFGLMRAAHVASLWSSADRDSFTLTAIDRARLQIVFAASLRAQQSASAPSPRC